MNDFAGQSNKCQCSFVGSTQCFRHGSKISSHVVQFLNSVARKLESTNNNNIARVQLILPAQDGYILRSDFLTTRLLGCVLVDNVQGFTTPQQKVKNAALLDEPAFGTLLEYSVGGILISENFQGTVESVFESLQAELNLRLALSWILPMPVTRNELALIGSRHDFVLEPWLKAARSIGIKMTVFGADGSWLQKPESLGIVDAYVPLNMTADSDLPSRLVAAIRSSGKEFDGVTTFSDALLYSVACVAQTLNLPTSPPASLARAIDKHATRIKFGGDGCQVLRAKGLDDLKHQIEKLRQPLHYPLIVKPCQGWNSEGVTKVVDGLELFAAVAKLNSESTVDTVIETYVDGPEFDANFILYDGEDLFCEINDGFPCSADSDRADRSSNFLETDMLYPSSLKADERAMIRTSLHSQLIAMGFRTGVFHVEGRVRNSASKYSIQDGMLDLYPKRCSPENKSSVFLLEVNARAPGIGALTVTTLTYGVDFAAIHMLCALNESNAVRALSQPFELTTSTAGGGAQYWVDLLSIPTQSDGVYDGDDCCEELKTRRPDLQPNIMWAMCCLKKGDYVPGPPDLAKVAYFVVISRKSRRDVLRAAGDIRAAVRIPLDVCAASARGPFAAVGKKIMTERSGGLHKPLVSATKVA